MAVGDLREARNLGTSIRHAVRLDTGLIDQQLQQDIADDCDVLLALLLAATAVVGRMAGGSGLAGAA